MLARRHRMLSLAGKGKVGNVAAVGRCSDTLQHAVSSSRRLQVAGNGPVGTALGEARGFAGGGNVPLPGRVRAVIGKGATVETRAGSVSRVRAASQERRRYDTATGLAREAARQQRR